MYVVIFLVYYKFTSLEKQAHITRVSLVFTILFLHKISCARKTQKIRDMNLRLDRVFPVCGGEEGSAAAWPEDEQRLYLGDRRKFVRATRFPVKNEKIGPTKRHPFPGGFICVQKKGMGKKDADSARSDSEKKKNLKDGGK